LALHEIFAFSTTAHSSRQEALYIKRRNTVKRNRPAWQLLASCIWRTTGV